MKFLTTAFFIIWPLLFALSLRASHDVRADAQRQRNELLRSETEFLSRQFPRLRELEPRRQQVLLIGTVVDAMGYSDLDAQNLLSRLDELPEGVSLTAVFVQAARKPGQAHLLGETLDPDRVAILAQVLSDALQNPYVSTTPPAAGATLHTFEITGDLVMPGEAEP